MNVLARLGCGLASLLAIVLAWLAVCERQANGPEEALWPVVGLLAGAIVCVYLAQLCWRRSVHLPYFRNR